MFFQKYELNFDSNFPEIANNCFESKFSSQIFSKMRKILIDKISSNLFKKIKKLGK